MIIAACSGDDDAAGAATADSSAPALTAIAVEPATTPPAPTTEAPTTEAPTTAAPTTVEERPLQILVTNDDGVGSAGIDVVVEALRSLDGVEVTVVAPATQQSGTGGSTTDGPVEAVETTTASGFPAIAVEGFPADSVIWAIDGGGIDVVPDLVVSGINEGQNLGPVVDLSGTVGAARAAATRGIPSIAISQGFSATEGGEPDFEAGAKALLDYLAAELDSIVDTDPEFVVNINVPTCAAGTAVRGVVEVPSEATGDIGLALTSQDCSSVGDAPPTEVAAFTAGYATITEVSPIPMPAA
jgi:5'-nucleotidase